MYLVYGPEMDEVVAKMDSLVTLRMELHSAIWERDGAFPICKFLMLTANKLRLMLPAAVAVYILSFLGEERGVHLYIKSDELFARVYVLGKLIRQAERLIFPSVRCVYMCVCVCMCITMCYSVFLSDQHTVLWC